MKEIQEFNFKYKCFKNKFRQEERLIIPGGRNFYRITDVTDVAVIITQNGTHQKHKVEYLKALFTDGFFYGPINKIRYDRSTRHGHLCMKNAIVDFLKQLDCP